MLKKMKKWKEKSKTVHDDDLLQGQIPEHIAIIMDGNGRWAKKRSLPRSAGHHEGMKVVKNVTKLANKLGVRVLTVYAFSTENWKRPKDEVSYLMKLPEEFLGTFLPELIQENVQVRIMGNRDGLPDHTVRAVERAIVETSQNDGLILNFALNYGSRAEIIQAIQEVVKDVKSNKVDEIDEELFSSYLMSASLPEPDLLIRTSGEMRLSNFMLWQLAYTEFWFTDILWPDFKDEHFYEAIRVYQKRGRRFGGI